MGKLICDVCGTSYPETANQCPICGCVRPMDAATVVSETDNDAGRKTENYTYVKGGRFSKGNVKKRNQGKEIQRREVERKAAPAPVPGGETPAKGNNKTKKNNSDMGLVIAVIVLLLAIIAVCIYIVVNFVLPPKNTQTPTNTNPVVSTEDLQTEDTQSQDITTEGALEDALCESLVISRTEITFEEAGETVLLDVSVYPEDTTDILVFSTGDPAVATVNDDGEVTAVGNGETVIVVTCGAVTESCTVKCRFAEETESTTEATTEPTTGTEPDDDSFKLNREDFTLTKKGEVWKLYSGNIPADQIVWSSDDEKVASVKNGVVTARGMGMTTVHAEYNGKKYSCTVRCTESVGVYQEDDVTPDSDETGFTINKTDVSIAVGETFTLLLTDKENNAVTVSWTADDNTVCTINGNQITGAAPGRADVSVVHEGYTYTCIVRVK